MIGFGHPFLSSSPTLMAAASGNATASRTGGGSATTNPVSIILSQSCGQAVFAWSVVSGAFTIDSPTSATTTFSESLSSGGSDSGVARCTVTRDCQVVTVDVNVSLVSAAPNPPVWNVDNGDNLGTFPRGGTTQLIPLFASSPGGVIYGVLQQFSYASGFGPTVTLTSGAGGAGSGRVSGAASVDCPPGDYDAVLSALNPADSSSSTIAVTVTVT